MTNAMIWVCSDESLWEADAAQSKKGGEDKWEVAGNLVTDCNECQCQGGGAGCIKVH